MLLAVMNLDGSTVVFIYLLALVPRWTIRFLFRVSALYSTRNPQLQFVIPCSRLLNRHKYLLNLSLKSPHPCRSIHGSTCLGWNEPNHLISNFQQPSDLTVRGSCTWLKHPRCHAVRWKNLIFPMNDVWTGFGDGNCRFGIAWMTMCGDACLPT